MRSNAFRFLNTKVAFGIFVLGSACFISCSRPDDISINSVVAERDSLQKLVVIKDSVIHHFSEAFDLIENNLLQIRKKQDILNVHADAKGEIVAGKTEEINKIITEINELMASNAQRVQTLQSRVEKGNTNSKALSTMVNVLADQVMVKNDELIGLSKILSAKNRVITQLGDVTMVMNQVDNMQQDTINAARERLKRNDARLNEAYFVIGNAKELKQKHVLTHAGKLNTELNPEDFEQVDRRKIEYIPDSRQSPGRIIRLLTTHPDGSYEFVKNDHGKAVNVKIKDPQEFWRISRYLVVETD
jgi:hypothetical protein